MLYLMPMNNVFTRIVDSMDLLATGDQAGLALFRG